MYGPSAKDVRPTSPDRGIEGGGGGGEKTDKTGCYLGTEPDVGVGGETEENGLLSM